MKRLLYVSAHSILEFDETRMFHNLGYDVFALGSYTVPNQPSDPKRPSLDLPDHPELRELLVGDMRSNLPQELVDWSDVIMFNGLPLEWMLPNWDKIKNKSVVWRTIGQSNPMIEKALKPYHQQGLQIVRYSPNERKYFEQRGTWAGEDALIRFAKDPSEWYGWTGERAEVGQVSQHDPKPHGRDAFTNWKWFEEATKGLPTTFAGSHSELIGGLGELGYEEMKVYLRGLGCYLYTGTIPASYTLGFIEAAMTGVPIVSISKNRMWSGPELFEADEIANWQFDEPMMAREQIRDVLDSPNKMESRLIRNRAIELFGIDTISKQWEEFLK